MLPKKTPVIILCGGRARRIRDVVRRPIPKPMIPIGDKPILWHIMKIYAAHGFNDFILCLGYKGWDDQGLLPQRAADGLSDFTLDVDGDERGSKCFSEPRASRLADHSLPKPARRPMTGERIARCREYVERRPFHA